MSVSQDNDTTSLNETIKAKVSTVILENNLTLERIILFGSRARGDFDRHSDYDILVIVTEQLEMRQKINVIEAIRTELAMLMISSDIIMKSHEEADYYKEKIGSVVREAFKEGTYL